MRNIQNSINGLIILSSSKNKSSEYLAQQSLQDTARYINSGESEYIRAGIENTLELLSRMRGQQRQGSSGDSILLGNHKFPNKLRHILTHIINRYLQVINHRIINSRYQFLFPQLQHIDRRKHLFQLDLQ